MAADREMDLTELKHELSLLQTDNERATEQFTISAEAYVQSQSDTQERTKKLVAEFVKVSSTYKNKTKNDAFDDPYVVVLLDGNAINFKDDLIRANDNGGLEAAKRLLSAIELLMSKTAFVPENSRVVVRIYADVRALSVLAFRSNLIDLNNQPQGLSTFASNFSQVYPFFDFIDIGDTYVVKMKIEESFKILSKDPQCQLILLGVSLSPDYIDMISAHQEYTGKLVVLCAGPVNSGYEQFDLKKTEFKDVFRPGSVPDARAGSTSASTEFKMVRPSSMNDQVPTKRTGPYCHNFANKGFCSRYRCKFDHVSQDPLNNSLAKYNLKTSRAPTSNVLNLPVKAMNDMIPVNEHNERIDIFMRPPTGIEWATYGSRFRSKKPCNAFYMRTNCDRSNCDRDHTPIDAAAYYCLQYILKGYLCSRRGSCRRLDCYSGHICQKYECLAGRAKGCKLPAKVHEIDRKVTDWVEPEQMDTTESRSAQESVPAVPASLNQSGGSNEWQTNLTADMTGYGDWVRGGWVPHPESTENWVDNLENRSLPIDYPLIDLS